ncbi:unnamed protein product [Eretmochelys imbricata]
MEIVPWGRCIFRPFEPLARYRVQVSSVATQTESPISTDGERHPSLGSSQTITTAGEVYPISGPSQRITTTGASSSVTVAQTEAEDMLPTLPLEFLNSVFGETVSVSPTPSTVAVTDGDSETRVQGKVLLRLPNDNPTCPFCGDHVGKPTALQVHLKRHHGGKDVEFQCSLCDKIDPKAHSILFCAKRFGTKSGLSQHKRRAHPMVRNAERIQASQPKQNSQRGKHKSCWSAEEELLLIDFDKMYSGEKCINKLIAEAMKTKTAKQISDKRRLLNLSSKTKSDMYMHEVKKRLRDQSKGPQHLAPFESEILTPEHETEGKGKKTKSTYRRYQHLFASDRCKLASIILDGTERLQCQIPPEEVFRAYKDKWETQTPFEGLGQFKSYATADNSAFDLFISAKEVLKNIKEMNMKTAPGPDQVSLRDLVRVDPEGDTLAGLFNAWLVTGVIPDGIKECRSLLIPKTMDPEALKELGNWRPLTIGSIVLRLFSRILTNRLAKACPLNARQRGFIAAPGCSENLKVLHLITKQAKKEKKPLGVVFIDIAKAFDSVSHDHIMWVLRERGLDQHMINIISDSYRNVHTRMEVGKELTQPIAIEVGVKQGDPMSPLLFNLALDPLISTLEKTGKGFPVDAQRVTALAFADDLVMLSDSWEGMNANIQILESFCKLSGLKVQARKCHGFLLSPTHDSFTVNNCEAWKIGCDSLNMIAPGESEKYLGLKVDPWIGFSKPALSDKLDTWLERINRASLKPSQKLEMLNTFTVPRVIYLADHTDCKKALLSSLDDKIRRAVKEWLHLPSDTCNNFIYARSRDGGLGSGKF